jgi:tetratricopeptide (TPR) repeat protein
VIPRFNMSAGELFELISPAVFLLSALLSTLVLASARKRFPLYAAFGWAAGTLLLPLIVLPVYLSVILFWRPQVRSRRWRLLLPLAYGVIAIAAISLYFYRDRQTVDAHLARAVQAKLIDDHATAIHEYRRALAVEDNSHTHKLLALELAHAGQLSEAITEFRIAQRDGEPDDFIYYELGLLFERLEQRDQAKLEFENFLRTSACLQGDARCDSAGERIRRMSE